MDSKELEKKKLSDLRVIAETFGIANAGLLKKEEIIKLLVVGEETPIEEKKVERFEQVVTECFELMDRYPESKWKKEVDNFLNQSQNNIKILTNEQTKTPA